MTRKIALSMTALGLIAFAWMNAEIAESVGTYQLDAAYACKVERVTCGGIDRFGSRRVMRSTK